jgi:UTP--glucose-1-phosphate uridylyltransferase
VHCAAELVGDEPFYVLLGDVIVPDAAMLPAMLALSREHGGASVIAVFAVPREQVSRFGVIGGELLSGGADGIGPAGGESSAGAQPDAAEQFSADEQPGAGEQPGAVWRITELTEKPPVDLAPSNLAIFGRYLLSPRVMELLAHTAPGAGGEIQLTDAMVQLLEEEEMYALVIDNNAGFDVGTIETWLDTNNRLNR